MSQISSFYGDKNVFVTGATGNELSHSNVITSLNISSQGFMGKVLVEKLLRDCERLGKIYILVRQKKGVSPQERYESYVNHVGEFLCLSVTI